MNINGTPPGKLKLDKLEIPPVKKAANSTQSENAGKAYMGGSNLSQDAGHGDIRKYVVILSAGLITLLFITIIFIVVWKTFFKQDETYKPWDIYAVIGPIHTTAGKAGEIRMTVNINCLKPEVRKIVIKKSARIKDRLLLSLNTPDVEQMIIKKNYDALKALIREEIMTMTDGNAIGDVYFSDFVVY